MASKVVNVWLGGGALLSLSVLTGACGYCNSDACFRSHTQARQGKTRQDKTRQDKTRQASCSDWLVSVRVSVCVCVWHVSVRAGERVGGVWTPPQPPTDGDSTTSHGPRNWVAAPNAATTWQQDGQDDSGRNGDGGGGGRGGGGQVAVGLGSALTVLGTVARVQSDEAELHGDDGELSSNFLTLSLCLSRACHGKARQSRALCPEAVLAKQQPFCRSASLFSSALSFSLLFSSVLSAYKRGSSTVSSFRFVVHFV